MFHRKKAKQAADDAFAGLPWPPPADLAWFTDDVRSVLLARFSADQAVSLVGAIGEDAKDRYLVRHADLSSVELTDEERAEAQTVERRAAMFVLKAWELSLHDAIDEASAAVGLPESIHADLFNGLYFNVKDPDREHHAPPPTPARRIIEELAGSAKASAPAAFSDAPPRPSSYLELVSDPVCPQCGTVFARAEVVRQIREKAPELFASPLWSTRFRCAHCLAEVPVSGAGDVRG